MSLMESLNHNRTKVQIVSSPTTKKGKRKREKGGDTESWEMEFLERE